ncbi:hypothetical protein A3862_05245 [Methylobacterium sp. XJLW]|uniref:hypothetical protein n=1 Tax=Methylobacterium sp. XJLW TaxID=739141 RepID=UPI000DAAE520|nr:hypothetical protein [Methylobacterium sp. XJLW]AWV14988.1 hypothetical protein A3862_05245 [Methylobacterium sp. XJLW]
MSASLRVDAVVEKLKTACAAAGGQSAWAATHGLSGAYVSDVCRGRRDPGDGVLRGLGLQRDVRYVPRKPETVTLYDADGVTLIEAEVLA